MCAEPLARVNLRPAPFVGRGFQQGLSIIELMVGMVIALLVGMAATGSANTFMASQRQGMGMGGVTLSANTALTAMRDEAASAGLGFFGDRLYRCHKINLSIGATPLIDGADFTPINVTAETAGDRIDVVYATQVASGANALLKADTTGADATVRSLVPAAVGDAVMLAPVTPGTPCLVRTVTAITASTDDLPQVLSFADTTTDVHNSAVYTTNPTFPDMGRITLLGNLQWSRYRLNGTNLELERPLTSGSTAVVLARNVIGFRTEYGLAAAAAGSTALQSWQAPTGGFAALTPALLPRVRALRIGMVTRSPQREKPDAAGNCNASATMPQLFGNTITPDVTDWQCYRYRTAFVVVPLRNLVVGL
jgi:type IV pilus assembly protein PilW